MKLPITDSIALRTLLVLIVGLAISHTLSVALYSTDRSEALSFAGGEHVAESMLTITRLVTSSPLSDRRRISELADDPKLHVRLTDRSMIELRGDTTPGRNALLESLTNRLRDGQRESIISSYSGINVPSLWEEHVRQQHERNDIREFMFVSFKISDKAWLNFAAPVKIEDSFWSVRFGLSMLVMLLSVVIFASLVVRYLTKPLQTFSQAAQRLGTDVNAPALPVTGPIEVRAATLAFNEMQDRIRRFLEDHTQLIAAISHDLGTPITRLRLRAEFVEDAEQKQKMLSDLDDMEKMVASALSLAREETDSEPQVMVDLRALVRRVCDDLLDLQQPVTLNIGDASVPFLCRPVALRRAITNLIENAVKYGERARVSLVQSKEAVRIIIEDDGPGISEIQMEEVFKPFHRLERSRNSETGGTGLGLTVSRRIVRSHGGDVLLKNVSEGGFLVEVYLPR